MCFGPHELESVVKEHPAVADCAVVGKPSPIAGEIPKAFVVPKEGARVTAAELIEFIEARVKRIREVEFVDTIPRDSTGRILRKRLIEQKRGLPPYSLIVVGGGTAFTETLPEDQHPPPSSFVGSSPRFPTQWTFQKYCHSLFPVLGWVYTK